MNTADTVTSAVASVTTYADALTSPARDVIAEMIASRGGIGLLVVGGLGVIVLAFDAAQAVARLIGRTGGPAAVTRSRISRSPQALVTTGGAREAATSEQAPATRIVATVTVTPRRTRRTEVGVAA